MIVVKLASVLMSLAVMACAAVGSDMGATTETEPGKGTAGKEGDAMQDKKSVYLTTIPAYNAYDPSLAKEHAVRDIRSGDISVFFLSVEEVPTPLVIEDGLERLPPFTYLAIGGGCTDEIGSRDVSDDYRKAFQKAVRYGELYNEAIARHFGLKVKPGRSSAFGSGSGNRTRAFLGDEYAWGGIRMELKDIQGPFGGRDVIVSGSGKVSVDSLRLREKDGKLKKKTYKIRLDQGDVRELVEVFITNDFLSIELPDEQMPPDTGHPAVTLVNAQGRSHTLQGWERTDIFPDADPEDPIVRFDCIYKALLRVERKAASLR